jgi:5-methylcytosine-specific restriction endonuclease McrA
MIACGWRPVRRSSLRRSRPRPRDDFERALEQEWREHARRAGGCARCGTTRNLDGHHVLPKADLRNWAAAEHIDPTPLIWNVANQLVICRNCHDRHHSGYARLPRLIISEQAWAFARSLGLDWKLERLYT